MDRSALLARVVRHVGEYLEVDVSHLKAESHLSRALPGLDSMRLFEMVLYLEDCFDVEFDEGVMEKIQTLGDLTDYIADRVSEPVSP